MSSILKGGLQKSVYCRTAYLYRKGNIYYFRYVVPAQLRERIGCCEVRISLGTGYLYEARRRCTILANALPEMLEESGMALTYKDIKSRLYRLLEDLFEEKVRNPLMPPEPEDPMETYAKGLTVNMAQRDLSKEVFTNPVFQKGMYEHLLLSQCKDAEDFERKKDTISHKIKNFTQEDLYIAFAERNIPFLIDREYFSREELTGADIRTKYLLGKALLQVEVELYERLCKDDDGEFDAFPGGTVSEKPTAVYAPSPAPQKSLLFSEAIEQYRDEKIKQNKWKLKSVPDHLDRLQTYILLKGDKPVSAITRGELISLRDTLLALPKNWRWLHREKKMSIAELMDTVTEETKTLSIPTVNNAIITIGGLLEWCLLNSYISQIFWSKLTISDDRSDIDKKAAFSTEELRIIFSHPHFTEGKAVRSAYFWAPLIALYSGMRREEISQLLCSDIQEEESIPFFSITEQGGDIDGKGKSVKRKASKRFVPIHPELIRLGLLDYRKHVVRQGHHRLFPELNVTEKTTDFGAQCGNYFNRMIKTLKLPNGEKKSFHSLRHTFENYFKLLNLRDERYHELIGHEGYKGEDGTYGERFPVRKLYEDVICKLDYELDLSGLENHPYTRLVGMKKAQKNKSTTAT